MKFTRSFIRFIKICSFGLVICAFWLINNDYAFSEEKGARPLKVIEIITVDDSGGSSFFPSYVYYDNTAEETYIIAGGEQSKISIFNPDYFPEISLGPLRGINSANSIFMTEQGLLYVCQSATKGKKNRVTVLNAAFFIQKEIFLENIPGVPDVTPNRIAVSREGNIYLTGYNLRDKGVLVLDSEGHFLRWLTPMDKIQKIQEKQPATAIDLGVQQSSQKTKAISALSSKKIPTIQNDQSESEPKPEENDPPKTVVDEVKEEEGALPSVLLPKAKESNLDLFTPDEYGPVSVSDIQIDSNGNIYLLSEEKGKIYVYSAKEQFLLAMGDKGGASGKLSRPRGFALDNQRGYIYVVDYMRHTILVYNMRTGRFIFEFGGRGTGPGWFNYPTSVAVDRHGNVIVADLFNRRVQVIDVNIESNIPVLQQIPGLLNTGDEQESDNSEQVVTPENSSTRNPENGTQQQVK